MKTIELNLPDNIEFSAKETQRFLAAKFYEAGQLSIGQAAEMAYLSKSAFMEILSDYNVNFINYSAKEAIADLQIL